MYERHAVFALAVAGWFFAELLLATPMAMGECLPRDASAATTLCDTIKQWEMRTYWVAMAFVCVVALVRHARNSRRTGWATLGAGLIFPLILSFAVYPVVSLLS